MTGVSSVSDTVSDTGVVVVCASPYGGATRDTRHAYHLAAVRHATRPRHRGVGSRKSDPPRLPREQNLRSCKSASYSSSACGANGSRKQAKRTHCARDSACKFQHARTLPMVSIGYSTGGAGR